MDKKKGNSMIKAIVFDLDGVIIDSEPLHEEVTREVLTDAGGNPENNKAFNFVGMRNDEMWTILKEHHKLEDTVERLLDKHKYYKYQRFFCHELKPIAGIQELMADAKKRGLGIALATSSEYYFAWRVLEKTGLIRYFNAMVTADNISNSKPHPEIYIKAAKALNISPRECIAIEDSYLGIKSAKSSGMKCIGFYNPNSGRQDLSQADIIVSSIKDINLDNIMQLYAEVN
jgi:HAD superfamily hydrolase (TIGR01509 family)